jgi:outer membrane lipoprotein SlyB
VPQPAICADCGTVAAVTPVQVKGEGSGAGAVIGAVAGGVAGHQVGGGRGKDVATAAGVILGAMAGHEVEKRTRSVTVYDISVRMDSGGQRVIRVSDPGGLTVGTPVRVEGNNIYIR